MHAGRAAGPPRCCASDGAPGGAANDQDRQPWPARRRLAARQAAAHRCGVSRAACARERDERKKRSTTHSGHLRANASQEERGRSTEGIDNSLSVFIMGFSPRVHRRWRRRLPVSQ